MLDELDLQDEVAHLPAHVMGAASWLYDDDVTAARAMLAQASKVENATMKATARRELELLKRTVMNGQVQTAS